MRRRQLTLILSVSLLTYFLLFSYAFVMIDFEALYPLDYTGIFLFFVLLLMVASFPIVIKGTNIVFIQAVTIAVFLQFGLLIEMILSQLAIFYLLFFRFRTRDLKRYFLNGTMLLFVSAGSALVFWGLGGELQRAGQEGNLSLIPVLGYITSNILINHTLLFIIQNKIRKIKRDWLGQELWWEVVPLAIIFPTGILISELYRSLGSQAILYVMIPIVSFSIIFKLYNRLETSNQKLKIINQTGSRMKGQLSVQQVIDDFVTAYRKLVPCDYMYVYKVNEPQKRLELIYFDGDPLHAEQRQQLFEAELRIGAGLSGLPAATGKSIRVGFESDALQFSRELGILHHRLKQNSILSVPLVRQEQVIGVVTISHSDTNRYSKEDLRLAEILASQAGIALRNAVKFEQAKRKSERDELTGLYNYRAFEHLLYKQVKEAQEIKKPLALVLLDIDYFKKVNDQYGHLEGNHVLYLLAKQLKQTLPDQGIVTRYGGEEFTVLLPDTDQEKAMLWAEKIRSTVEGLTIPLHQKQDTFLQDTLIKEAKSFPKGIQVTVSIGVAVYPEHAQDALSLVRYADRAMYTGAKQKGRNRVAVYQTG